MPATPSAQLSRFIRKYSPGVATQGRAVLAKLRRLMPGAVELVYDNYQWLVVGFGPSEKASHAVLSMVFVPGGWITICFLQGGPRLPDPHKLLRGSGRQVRSMRLASPKDLDKPAVRALIRVALDRAVEPIDPTVKRRLVIKSISAKQKPRRAGKAA
jgi:hypothetical protein